MKKVYNVSIVPLTAFHINAGIGPDGRRVYVKNGREAYIPGTTVKGVLRNNIEMLIKKDIPNIKCTGKENGDAPCDCPMCTLFGKAGFQPSRVIVDNFYADNTISEVRTNNAISRHTKKTLDGALVSYETVSAVKHLSFDGNITVYYTEDTKKYEQYVLAGLSLIDSIGSSKSRGLGWVDVEVKAL